MRALTVLLSSMSLLACGVAAPAGNEAGEAVYRQPLTDGNTFACSTCHALTASDDSPRRAAHPIGGASRRGLWKNGAATTFLEAVNVCVKGWQGAPAWAATDPRFSALSAFLDAQGDQASEQRLTFAQVAPPMTLGGGQAARGQVVFNETCALCHGTDGAGSVRGPNLYGTQPTAELVASRVRGFPLVGRMPFWAEDRMSDDELRDVIAWLRLPAERPDAGTYLPAEDAGTMDAGSPTCGVDHPRVGWTTQLQTRAHGVRGRITATSNCTLTLSEFFYDGNGIDVRLVGAPTLAQLGGGLALGPQLYRPGTPWENATLTIALPAGTTLDEVSALSVWCVAVGVSFGDGVLRAP